MTQDVDIFDGIANADETTTSDTSDNTDSQESEKAEPVVVTTIPDGAVSVTDFASWVSQVLMREKIQDGLDLDGTEYTIPQTVYQAIKAQRNPLPHVLVKDEDDDKEPRVYVLRDEALIAWRERLAKNKERGTGAGVRASSRTPEDLLVLLADAVKRSDYAVSRRTLWETNLDQATKLVTKYKGFLSEAGVDDATVDMAIAEAQTAFKVEQEAKAAEKAAKKSKEKVDA